MTQIDDGEVRHDEKDVRALQQLLAEQAQEIEKLSKELAASYRKELAFFDNLEQHDRTQAKLEKRNRELTFQRDALRKSPGGVAQRAVWYARKNADSPGRVAQKAVRYARKKVLKGGTA